MCGGVLEASGSEARVGGGTDAFCRGDKCERFCMVFKEEMTQLSGSGVLAILVMVLASSGLAFALECRHRRGCIIACANPVQYNQVVDTKDFRDPNLILVYSSAAMTVQPSVVPP